LGEELKYADVMTPKNMSRNHHHPIKFLNSFIPEFAFSLTNQIIATFASPPYPEPNVVYLTQAHLFSRETLRGRRPD
jgi:hypothetical protein